MIYACAEDKACSNGVACGDNVASGRWATLASSLSNTDPPGASRGWCNGSRFSSTSFNFFSPSSKTCGSLNKVWRKKNQMSQKD